MTDNLSITELLKFEANRREIYLDLMSRFLTFRAAGKDAEVDQRLLRELVLKYSATERKLVELNQLKNKFLGMAAHDMRNPLVSIRGFAEILLADEENPLTEDQREFVTMMHSSSQGMLELVNDLLDVSVIESGRLTLNFETGSLKKTVEGQLRINRVPAEAKGIRVVGDLDEVRPGSFDPKRIAQVVDNLVGNAVKFSPPGSRIRVRLAGEKRGARLSVTDQGPGLSPEDREKLFGDFQRLSAQPTGDESSTGLGLAIVKKIVDAHQGTVDVESVQGQGATFSFYIPLEELA